MFVHFSGRGGFAIRRAPVLALLALTQCGAVRSALIAFAILLVTTRFLAMTASRMLDPTRDRRVDLFSGRRFLIARLIRIAYLSTCNLRIEGNRIAFQSSLHGLLADSIILARIQTIDTVAAAAISFAGEALAV